MGMDILAIIGGAAALIFGIVWYTQIQVSRKNDEDFEKRDHEKESLVDRINS